MQINESTVDPKELAYYESLAHQWWDEQGRLWPLHRLNQLRVAYLSRQICMHFGRFPDQPKPLRAIDDD